MRSYVWEFCKFLSRWIWLMHIYLWEVLFICQFCNLSRLKLMVSDGLRINFDQNLYLKKLSRGSPFMMEFAAGVIPCSCSLLVLMLDLPFACRPTFYSERCQDSSPAPTWRAEGLSSRWAPLHPASVVLLCYFYYLNISNFMSPRLLEWFVGIGMWG